MSPTSDKKPDTHNKIPEDATSSQSHAANVDHSDWGEYVQQHGSGADRLEPHVRYGFIDEENGFRQGGLEPLTDRIPAEASFASTGIYFLTQEEVAQVERGIPAKRIQTACEEDDRVAYTVVAESDAMEKQVSVQTIIDWLLTLATQKLGMDGSECSLFYSGNRSIHLHSSYFVRHENLAHLKETVEEFCQKHGADIDLSIYDPKSQFRLIGANHIKTDMFKVEIGKGADRSDVIRSAQNSSSLSLPHSIPKGRKNNLVAGNGGRSPLPQEYESRLLWEYIKRASSDSGENPDTDLDGSYTNRYFSPYANTGDGERSICVFEPKGDAFRRGNNKIYLPSHIYGSRGADGEYVIRDRKAPVLLSKEDYEKREFETGETLVIIGGQSRRSRIFEIDEFDRELISNQLNLPDHDDQRQLVFTWLEDQGYPVGESGMHGEPRESNTGASPEIQQLKQKLIQADRAPTHEEALSVSCSILQTDGYKEAWEWNKKAWGDQFDPEITRNNLRDIVQRYPEDYGNLNILMK